MTLPDDSPTTALEILETVHLALSDATNLPDSDLQDELCALLAASAAVLDMILAGKTERGDPFSKESTDG